MMGKCPFQITPMEGVGGHWAEGKRSICGGGRPGVNIELCPFMVTSEGNGE